jgi:septal ring factor EnvC (AmiA/AmiB activator)
VAAAAAIVLAAFPHARPDLSAGALAKVEGRAYALAPAQSAPDPAAQRVAERLRALQREADDLASREKTLLIELRQLELQRQIKTAELGAIDAELKRAEAQMADAQARATSLSTTTESARPDIEARMVRLYKMGRGGYWRLLLNTEGVRALGRAYRTAAAMSNMDRDRVQHHAALVKALTEERAAIQARTQEARSLRDKAAAARVALDQAVAERTALVSAIDVRRDLAAQMAGELRTAQERLERTIDQAAEQGAAVRVPLRPFRGDLPWPATGIVLRRFGRMSTGSGGITVINNGIDLSVAEGHPVAAVHEGVVTFAASFTGFGNVVIVDHGDRAQSLYGHLSALDVSKGERVTAGARLGSSGRNLAGNPSLYFELRIDGKPVDPLQWLRPQQ